MANKEVIEEMRGTITEIYSYSSCDYNNVVSKKYGAIIKPDDKKDVITSVPIVGDHLQFEVGQRVVLVTYTWKRPATNGNCPDEKDVYDFVIYDEKLYDKKRKSSKKKRQLRKKVI